VLDPSTHRKRKFDPILQGRKADFSAYAQTKGNRYYLLVSEIKSARYISSKKINFVDCDLVKVGNKMKDMLDKCIENGVKSKDLAICSILVEGKYVLVIFNIYILIYLSFYNQVSGAVCL